MSDLMEWIGGGVLAIGGIVILILWLSYREATSDVRKRP